MAKLKIALLAGLKRPITLQTTVSRNRIVLELAQGLVKKGHEVTLFGTSDSNIPGVKIVGVIPKGFVEMPSAENPFYEETGFLVSLAKKIEDHALEFDIIHNHTYPEFINLLIADKIKTPMVTTIHAQATGEFDNTLSLFPNSKLISISKAHSRLFKKTKFENIVYNGVDTNLYSFSNSKREYLLWLGRMSKAKNKDGSFMDPKGIRWAIELARQTGERLLLSGNVEDIEFYNKDVKPFLNDKIQWVGPVSSEQALSKEEVISLMQGAKAFLMTINWEEPFGLVMAEAMACGTPVIAYNRGSTPELVLDGLTGFIIEPEDSVLDSRWIIKKKGIEGLVEAIKRIGEIDRAACRKHIEKNFSVSKMVDGYEKVYQDVIDKHK